MSIQQLLLLLLLLLLLVLLAFNLRGTWSSTTEKTSVSLVSMATHMLAALSHTYFVKVPRYAAQLKGWWKRKLCPAL